MSTIVPQELTTGVFTQSDKNSLENKLILVFGTPEKLEKKELLAQVCYSTALQDCTSYGCLYIVCKYSISNCWDKRRAVYGAIINVEKYKYYLHPNAYQVLVSIGERNGFTGTWTTFIKGFDLTGL